MLQKGEVIGGMYQIIQEIGKGGTGIIYLGYHLRLQKQIVIKKIKEHYAGRVNVRAEADILKKLHHTYLPQVYDFFMVGPSVYTVMEYIEGNDMQYFLDQGIWFSEKTVMLWLRQLCEVLCYLHSQTPPIFHSDIKPGNIMITRRGDICLIDFNISLDGEAAKDIQGISQYYAAPEQYRCALHKVNGEPTGRDAMDGRMDIYSLAAVFYRIMTGQLPDPGVGAPVPIMELNISYSEGLKSVIKKAMHMSPGRRFQTAEQMGKALQNVSRMDPQYRLLTKLQYMGGFLYALCVIIGILLIYSGVGIWQRDSWQVAYRSFYEATEKGDETQIVSEGTEILNTFLLKGYMKAHPDEKAKVLHALGESYYRQGDYGTAQEYYEDGLQETGDNALYFRDFVTALAKAGMDPDIGQISAGYPAVRMEDAEITYVEAFLAYEGGDSAEALVKAEAALSGSTDRKLNVQICELQADIYSRQEDYGHALAALENALHWEQDRNLLRRAGQAAYEAGKSAATETDKRAYYDKAFGIYEQLCQKASPSYEDQMNRALVLRALGHYESSLNELKRMKDMNASDYRILMWICYNYLDIAAVSRDYGSIENDLGFYYNSCRYEYQKQDTTDAEMEALIRIMEEME